MSDGFIYDLDNSYTTINNVLLDIEKEVLSHYAKDLLIQYKKYAGQNGRAYPSIKTLAAKVICSERSIQSAKRELKEKGYLLCINRFNNNPNDKLYKQQLPSIIILLPLDEMGKPKQLSEDSLKEFIKKVIEREQEIHKDMIYILEDTHVQDLRKTKTKKKSSINVPGESHAPGEGAPNSPGTGVNLMHPGGESHAPKKYDNKNTILEDDEDDAFLHVLKVFRDNIDNFTITPNSKKLEFIKLLYNKYGYEYLDKLIEHCCDYNAKNPYGYFKKTVETFIVNKIDTVEKLENAIINWQEVNSKLGEKERKIRKRKLSFGEQVKRKDRWNDYQQREYDFDDLEKKLLGWMQN